MQEGILDAPAHADHRGEPPGGASLEGKEGQEEKRKASAPPMRGGEEGMDEEPLLRRRKVRRRTGRPRLGRSSLCEEDRRASW